MRRNNCEPDQRHAPAYPSTTSSLQAREKGLAGLSETAVSQSVSQKKTDWETLKSLKWLKPKSGSKPTFTPTLQLHVQSSLVKGEEVRMSRPGQPEEQVKKSRILRFHIVHWTNYKKWIPMMTNGQHVKHWGCACECVCSLIYVCVCVSACVHIFFCGGGEKEDQEERDEEEKEKVEEHSQVNGHSQGDAQLVREITRFLQICLKLLPLGAREREKREGGWPVAFECPRTHKRTHKLFYRIS